MRPLQCTRSLRARHARGAILLDGLIAILIFSIGILSVVALQALGIRHSSNSQYRIAAALYADRLIAQMWASAGNPAALAHFASGGDAFAAWQSMLAADLPGSDTHPPAVVVNGAKVTITVSWRLPSESDVHAYTTTSEIVP